METFNIKPPLQTESLEFETRGHLLVREDRKSLLGCILATVRSSFLSLTHTRTTLKEHSILNLPLMGPSAFSSAILKRRKCLQGLIMPQKN